MEVTIEVVALAMVDGTALVAVPERTAPPFRGWRALPGGPLGDDQSPEAGARAVVGQLGCPLRRLDQIAAFGAPERDPRHRSVSIAFLAAVAPPGSVNGRWLELHEASRQELAFDHAAVLAAGIDRPRSLLSTGALATALCPDTFTISELRAVHEALGATTLDAGNFHRRVLASPGLLEPLDATTTRGGGRPARLYRGGAREAMAPPHPHGL